MTDDAKQEREAMLTASEKEQLLDYVRWVVCPCCKGAAVNYALNEGCIVCGQDGRILNSTANRIGDLLARYKFALRQPKTVTVTVVSAYDSKVMHTFKINPAEKTYVRPDHSMFGYVFEPEEQSK